MSLFPFTLHRWLQAADITTVDSAQRHEGILSITMEGKGEVK